MPFILIAQVLTLVKQSSSTNKKNEIHLKCKNIDGSVVNGIREPIQFQFLLNISSGCKIICEPQTIHYRKLNKSVLNTITFHLENDDYKEVEFIGEAITSTLQMIKA